MQKKCEDCPSKSKCSNSQDPTEIKIICTLKNIKNKIAILSGKGGVGKTTVAVNLAAQMAKQEKKVGLLDADLHGPNVAKMLGAEKSTLKYDEQSNVIPVTSNSFPNLKIISTSFMLQNESQPVIWRGPLKHQALRQFLSDILWEELDYLIIDLPPGTGDEALSIANIIKDMDGFIIVTTPQEVSLLDTKKSINFAKMLNIPILGIIENMSGLICPHCQKEIFPFKQGGAKELAKNLDIEFLGAIPMELEIMNGSDKGTFISEKNGAQAHEIFERITKKIIKKLQKK